MKKIILISSFTLLNFGAAAQLHAADDVKGFYLGGGITSSSLNDADFAKDRNITLKNDMSNGYKLYAGYMFNKVVGVELSYNNLGEFKYINPANSSTLTVKPTTIGIGANLGYTFESGLRPFATIGLGSLNMNQQGSKMYEDDTAMTFKFGAGLQYEPAILNGVAFRAGVDYDMFAVKEQYRTWFGTTTDGKTYWNTLANLYISAQYRF